MHIDWWTLALQTVNVLVLVWLLKRFLLQPVAAIIESRQAAVRKLLEDAGSAKAKAEAEKDKMAEEASHLAGTRNEALKAIASEGEAAKAAMLAAAAGEVERLRLSAESDMQRARQSEAAVYAGHAKDLAIDIAEKLLARLPDEVRVGGFIDGLADAVAALPAESRNGIGADAAPVRLKAARSPTEKETENCRAKLAEVLGRSIELEIVVAPELIAGLEIVTPHVLVRNSFRADLERIGLELDRHDHAGQ